MSKLTILRNYLLTNLGLNYSKNQEKDLYNKIGSAAKGFNFDKTDNFINWLINQTLDSEQIEKLAVFLTIGETYFCREKKALDYLEFTYLPDLINKRRGKDQQLKIWSAGCASGEEPYSVAIMLKRVIPDIKNWKITILATDINSAFIKKAKKGVYTKWSFRKLPESFKTRHFKKIEKEKYSINQYIKKMVTFSYLNLATDPYPSLINETNAFDIILCRNVLIYFSNKGIKTVTSKFYNSLINNGVLLVSPVESSNLISSKFYNLIFNGITVYIKDPEAATKQLDNTFQYPATQYVKKPKFEFPVNHGLYQTKKQESKTLATFAPKLTEIPLPISPKEIVTKKKAVESPDYKRTLELYKAGSFDEAEELTENVIYSNFKNKNPYILLLARIKANKGQLDESEKLCLEAISIDKVNAEAHYLHATILSEQGKVNEAINALNRTLFLDPDFALGHFLLGNISSNIGKKAEGKKHFNNALKSLAKLKHDEILAETDGLTVGSLSELINSVV